MSKKIPTVTSLVASTLFGFGNIFSGNSVAANFYALSDLGELDIIGPPASYEIQDLRIRINDNNEVVGWERNSTNSTSLWQAFTWNNVDEKAWPLDNSKTQKLVGLNNVTQYIGFLYDTNNKPVPTIWNNNFSTALTIPTLIGSENTTASINMSGQVALTSLDSNGIDQASIWNNGILSLITNSTTVQNEASSINDAGFVTGKDTNHAFFWNGSTLSSLSQVNTELNSSWGSDINNNNKIVGGFFSGTFLPNTRPTDVKNSAFLWDTTAGTNAEFVDLGISKAYVTWASAINDNDLVVGTGRKDNIQRALLWENNLAYELDSLVINLGEWKLIDASDINASGHIVGVGIKAGVSGNEYHAFLLTPQTNSPASADLALNAVVVNSTLQKPDYIASTISTKPLARAISVENNQNFALELINHGPNTSTNIVFTFASSIVADIDNLVPSKGNCDSNSLTYTITCEISSLEKNETATFSFNLDTSTDQEFDISANVVAEEMEPLNGSLNSLEETVLIKAEKVTLNPSNPTPETDPGGNKQTTGGSTTSDKSENSTTKATSSGCTINKTSGFDPMFFVLLFCSLIGIYRIRK